MSPAPRIKNPEIEWGRLEEDQKIRSWITAENCPDTRNTKIFDIVKELREYGIEPTIADPTADAAEAKHLYGVEFVDIATIKDMDAVVLAVAHDAFAHFTIADMDKLFGAGKKVLLDIKGLLNRTEYEKAGYSYWRL